MQHPSPSKRPWFALGSGMGALGFLAGMVFLGRYAFGEARGSGSALHFGAMLGWTSTAALVGTAFTLAFVALLRGPPRAPGQVITSHEPGAFCALLVATLFLGSFAASVWHSTLVMGDEAPLLGYALAGGLGLIAALCGLGTLVSGRQLAVGRRSRLLMPDRVVYAGRVLDARLELPFAAELAPRVQAELALIRSWYRGGGDMTTSDEVELWRGIQVLDEWEPAGSNTCRATLRIKTCAGTPSDFDESGVSYYWKLWARSATDEQPYAGCFIVPIAFDDAYDEGHVSTPGHERARAA